MGRVQSMSYSSRSPPSDKKDHNWPSLSWAWSWSQIPDGEDIQSPDPSPHPVLILILMGRTSSVVFILASALPTLTTVQSSLSLTDIEKPGGCSRSFLSYIYWSSAALKFRKNVRMPSLYIKTQFSLLDLVKYFEENTLLFNIIISTPKTYDFRPNIFSEPGSNSIPMWSALHFYLFWNLKRRKLSFSTDLARDKPAGDNCCLALRCPLHLGLGCILIF